jgi:hypothetical protein
MGKGERIRVKEGETGSQEENAVGSIAWSVEGKSHP